MEILLLIILLLVFLLPSFLMMRKQKRNQAEIQSFQNALNSGDRVVTVSGLHGTVTAIGEDDVELEVAPQVRVTVEKMSVVRYEHTGQVGTSESAAATGAVGQGNPQDHPEQFPDDQQRRHVAEEEVDPDNRDSDGRSDGGHPENLR